MANGETSRFRNLHNRVIALGLAQITALCGAEAYVGQHEHTTRVEACVVQACGRAATQDIRLESLPNRPIPNLNTTKPEARAHGTGHIGTASHAAPKPKERPTSTNIALPFHPRIAHGSRPLGLSGSGFDISWPQCAVDQHAKKRKPYLSSQVSLPRDANFAIIGLNGGKETDANICFADELAAAQKIAGTNVSVYANTANPFRNTQKARAHGKQTALADLERISVAAQKMKLPLQPIVWLDVERGNTWQSDTAAGHASNAAMLEGMVAVFRQANLNVGIYTAKDVDAHPKKLDMWRPIMGAVQPQSVLNVAEWIASPGADGCTEAPFIRTGRVVLQQNVIHDIDIDRTC